VTRLIICLLRLIIPHLLFTSKLWHTTDAETKGSVSVRARGWKNNNVSMGWDHFSTATCSVKSSGMSQNSYAAVDFNILRLAGLQDPFLFFFLQIYTNVFRLIFIGEDGEIIPLAPPLEVLDLVPGYEALSFDPGKAQ